MRLGDRRRPGLPGELAARVAAITFAIALLQLAALGVGKWTGGGPAPAVVPALGQFAAMGVSMLLIGRLAYRFFDTETAGLACLAAAMAVPVLTVFSPLEVDPLAWAAVGLLLALNGLMAREARAGGWAIGAGAALWLVASPTGGMMVLGLLALVAGKWLRNRADRWWLVHTLAAVTACTALAVATRWAFDGVSGCPGIGFGHLAAMVWATTITALSAALEPHPRAFTLGGFVVAIGGAGALLAASSQGCAPGSLLALDSARPLWNESPALALQTLGLPLVALYTTLHLFGRAGDWLRRWWLDYLLLTLLAVVLAVADTRIAPTACVLAAVPLGWQLREWGRAARNARRNAQRAMALAGFAAAMVPALPLTLALSATPSRASASATP